jgi:hypothetical protein
MGRFVEGEDRSQSTLLPGRLDDYVKKPLFDLMMEERLQRTVRSWLTPAGGHRLRLHREPPQDSRAFILIARTLPLMDRAYWPLCAESPDGPGSAGRSGARTVRRGKQETILETTIE